MGCKIPKSSIIQIKCLSKDNSAKTSLNSKEYYNKKKLYFYNGNIMNEIYFNSYNNKLTPNLWKKVVDFLPYKDLKEVGKINWKFNKISKSDNVLVKFFKKKNSHDIIYEYKSIDSFSQLRKNDNSECNYSVFIQQ